VIKRQYFSLGTDSAIKIQAYTTVKNSQNIARKKTAVKMIKKTVFFPGNRLRNKEESKHDQGAEHAPLPIKV
jgi:hypothetical protein